MTKSTLQKKNFNLKNYRLPDKYGNWLGYKIRKIDKKKFTADFSLRIREDHLSSAGRVHGGVISGLFDFACGAAVFSTMERMDLCSTVELKINYFKPVELGDELVGHSRVMFRGNRLRVAHALLFRKGEKSPVAMATATFNVVIGNVAISKRGNRKATHR